MQDFEKQYNLIHNGDIGFYKMPRGLFEVSGGEAVQFLNGLITNDVAKLDDGGEMLAAFPTLKGRIFAIVRVKRLGDKFLFETEEETRQKVYDNLFRFTFAGDFHLEDLSGNYEFFRVFGDLNNEKKDESILVFGNDYLVPSASVGEFKETLGDAVEISDEVYEVLRIEKGIPKYGIDMDEETVVPEIGLEDLVSYQKGCYIGQEVIARIHFRGKPAKLFRGLVLESGDGDLTVMEGAESDLLGAELKSVDDKNAGVITSVAFSPKLGNTIALGFVRNAFSEEGIELTVNELSMNVSNLPIV